MDFESKKLVKYKITNFINGLILNKSVPAYKWKYERQTFCSKEFYDCVSPEIQNFLNTKINGIIYRHVNKLPLQYLRDLFNSKELSTLFNLIIKVENSIRQLKLHMYFFDELYGDIYDLPDFYEYFTNEGIKVTTDNEVTLKKRLKRTEKKLYDSIKKSEQSRKKLRDLYKILKHAREAYLITHPDSRRPLHSTCILKLKQQHNKLIIRRIQQQKIVKRLDKYREYKNIQTRKTRSMTISRPINNIQVDKHKLYRSHSIACVQPHKYYPILSQTELHDLKSGLKKVAT